MRELAAIIIPWLGVNAHPIQRALIRHTRKKLPEFSFVFIGPDNLDERLLKEEFPECTVYKFDTSFFEDGKGYASLTLREDFYELFGWSEFILLFEPNSFIISNQLYYWCKQGYDYISGDRLSLRNVDTFLSQTKKNKREIHHFLSSNPTIMGDRMFWDKKSRGIWPALRSPTAIVSAYFSKPMAIQPTTDSQQELPFAFTGFDIHSESHRQWLAIREL